MGFVCVIFKGIQEIKYAAKRKNDKENLWGRGC